MMWSGRPPTLRPLLPSSAGQSPIFSFSISPFPIATGLREAAAAGSLERPGAGLTARERDVLALLGEGRGDAEIALALGISPRTVVNHCARLREKLGLHTRAGLIAHAKRVGLAPRD